VPLTLANRPVPAVKLSRPLCGESQQITSPLATVMVPELAIASVTTL